MSGRDEAGRGATRQAGIGRALPTGWSGRDEVGRGPPGPRLVPGPAPRSQLYLFQLNPTNDDLRDTAAHIYEERATSREFTHVYITTGDESIPLRWCIAFAEKEAIDIPPPIFQVNWPQVWPSEASFALIERRDDGYYIESELLVPYREILSLEVFSFPKL
jgi:hypothetical protein